MKNDKKVKIVIDARPLSMSHTGVAFHILLMIEILLKAGYDVTLVSNKLLTSENELTKKCDFKVIPGNSRFYWEQISLLKFLKRNNFDIYIASWNYGLPYFYEGKTKFLLVILDLIPANHPDIHLRNPIDRLNYFLSLRVAVKKAQKIIAISETSAKDFKYRFPNKEIAPIFINFNLDSPQKTENHYGKYFVYLGGVDPRKNIDRLLEAFAIFGKKHSKDYNLVLIGKGFEFFDHQINELGIKDKVIKTGYISDEEKLIKLASSSALIYPSSVEGYGLPVAEAILCDAPIITGEGNIFKEVAGDAAIYVDPKNPEEIVEAMNNVLDPVIQNKLKEAREKQKKKISSDGMEKKIMSTIKEILGMGDGK